MPLVVKLRTQPSRVEINWKYLPYIKNISQKIENSPLRLVRNLLYHILITSLNPELHEYVDTMKMEAVGLSEKFVPI
jgi:hypothetical protein